jgi:putative ABC transport system permease protein
VEVFLQDVRYALRGLRKAPGFTAAAVLTLALGMGATTAVFSVIRAVLLAPLPYAEPERRVMIWSRWTDFRKTWVADAEVMDYRRRLPSLESVAAWDADEANVTGGGGEPVRVGIARVTANTFETLGARPLVGRGFTDEEDRPGGAPVAVLSWGLWQKRFGGDPSALGVSIELDGVARRVVGVMPRGFALPTDFHASAAEPSQVWVPIQFDPKDLSRNHGYYAAGLLRRGATARPATEELASLAEDLTREGVYPRAMRFSPFALSMDEEIRGDARRALGLVFGAVLFLLLMACANVANLLLARADGRQREISVRAAIGAGKLRLVRQLLTESFVLACGGGAVGIAMAWAGVRLLAAQGGAGLPALAPLGIEPRMLAFAAVLTVATTFLFGFAPALQALRLDLAGSLKDTASSTSAGLRRQGLRGALATAQMAMAVLLLVGAGLMLRSLAALLRVDLGFEPRHVLTLQVRPPEASYEAPEAVVAFYRAMLEGVRSLPGVRSAGLVRSLPLAAEIGDWGLDAEGYEETPERHAKGDWQVVSEGALEALGERLLRGRPLEAADTAEASPVVLVNETLARTYWGGQDPIGKHLRMGSKEGRPWMRVVGVVKDERHNGVTSPIKEKFYVPYAQFPKARGGDAARGMTIVVRADGDPMALVAPIRAEVRRLDPALPVANARRMTDVVDASLATPRLTGALLVVFAALALALAGVGVAGVLSYLVGRRRREIGVRLALGASRSHVLALVVRRGMAYAGIGVLVGSAAAWFAAGALDGLLYGVAPRDAATFAGVAAILFAIAAAASAVPAARAARVNPVEALRSE